MSIYIDTLVEVVEVTLTKRDASGTVTYLLGVDFYAANALYSGSPIVYPILVRPALVQRAAGEQIAVRQEVTISLYGQTHFTKYGFAFIDLLQQYEFMNAAVKIYFIPKTETNAGTFTAADNTRMVLECYDHDYDEASGVVTLACRDTWFKDREITRRLDSEVFPDLDPDWEGEYGATVFADSQLQLGTGIDNAVIESGIDGSNRPYAKIFSGWTFPSHDMGSGGYRALYVRNQTPDILETDPLSTNGIAQQPWHILTLASDPQTAYGGEANFTDIGVTPLRLLSRYSYARTWSGGDEIIIDNDEALLLTAVQARLTEQKYYWCADFQGASMLSNGQISEKLTLTNNWTISLWVYLDTKAANQTIICVERDSTERAWSLWYDSSADRFKFTTYNNAGGTFQSVTASTFGSPSAGTWYNIAIAHYQSTPQVNIYVNGTGDTSVSTTGTRNSTDAGLRIGGRGQADQYLDGRVAMIQAFNKYHTAGSKLTSLYNSGNGKFSWDLSDTDKDGCIAAWDLTETFGSRGDSFGSYDLKESGTVAATTQFKNEALVAADGELSLDIYVAEYDSTADRFKPREHLRTSIIDHMASGISSGSTIPFFQIVPALVMNPGIRYWFELSWSGKNPQGRSMQCNFKTESGAITYRRNLERAREINSGYEKLTNTKLDMAFFVVGQGDDAFKAGTTSGSPRYAYQHLEAKSITLTSGQSHVEFVDGVEFKTDAGRGIKDDGSGTYTGSAGAQITNPADLVHFVCRNSDFGMGLSTSVLNTSSFASVRSLVAAFGLNLSLVLDYSITARELIALLCRQARMRFYKQRDGKLALNYPTSISSLTAVLSEAVHRAELELISSLQEDETGVVNDLTLLYKRDNFNAPKDAAFLRRAQTDKFAGLVYQGASSGTVTDTLRQDNLTRSQSLYGKRELKETLDCYDTEEEALKVLGYLADRYYMRRKRVIVRVPRKRFYSTLDLFSTVQIQHSGIPCEMGSEYTIKPDDAGQPISLYFEGTPVTVWAGGTIQGEVVAVQEEGAFMTLTVEEVPSLPG